jgi:uncharacterized protein (TIGR02284 family)
MADRTERAVLNHLIELCKDGERGFHAAADYVHDPWLKSLFTDLAIQREKFAAELSPYMHRVGGQDVADGSTAGALHRRWMAVKDVVTGHRDHAIVVEAERGEHAALAAYEDAVNGMLSPTVRDVIERQLGELKQANDRVRALDTANQNV